MADPQPPDPPPNGAAVSAAAGDPDPNPAGPTSKRQRRPSVRLGDIGDPPAAEPHPRRPKYHWKPSSSSDLKPPSRTRPLTNLSPSDDPPVETLALPFRKGLRDGKPRRGPPGPRRVRTNWISPHDEGPDAAEVAVDEVFREGSDDAPSETDGDDWNGVCQLNEDDGGGGGVRSWLDRMGLGRYTPVFEIHEVDEEVLPLLTLEDLKDMGISAVGSRRKMYCAIQKLRKSFS